MRRYERASTLITSNRPVKNWGKLLGDSAAVSAMLDRLCTTDTSQMWPAQLANQDRQSGRKPMIKLTATAKTKAVRMPGKRARQRRDLGSKSLPRRSLTLGILVERRNPPTASPSGQRQRVSITHSFGANPVSSAMDHSARRDPGRAKPQYQTTLRGLNPSLAKTRRSKVKQSRLWPIPLAGFELITYGRF